MMIDLSTMAPATPDASERLTEFLRLMADSTRRTIFLQLMQGETCNCELASLLHLSENLISHHIRQLRAAGLIQARRDPADQRWIYYSVDPESLGTVCGEFLALFAPAHLGERTPRCLPEG